MKSPPARATVGMSAGQAAVMAAAEVLLEFNVRSSVLSARIAKLAAAVGAPVEAVVTYRDVALYFDGGPTVHVRTPEYRLNVAVSSAAMQLVEDVCAGQVAPAAAAARFRALRESPAAAHGLLPLLIIFGVAASALAVVLHADLGTVIVTGVSSALGLLARKALGRRHWPLFSLPFVAAVIGGVIGGLAIRFGLTRTPGLCLVVPALMLVPGPHLINGVADVFENQIQTGVARLVLSTGVLLSAAVGVMAGAAAAVDVGDVGGAAPGAFRLTLALDVVMAGLAACGFGAFYNAPWRVLWISIACGMIGHGIRFVCLADGLGLAASTFPACAAIGLLAAAAGRRLHLPFPSLAFAAAVPMMPGLLVYRAIAGGVRLSASGTAADPADATAVFVLALQAAMVVGAMAAGLLAGSLATSAIGTVFVRSKDAST